MTIGSAMDWLDPIDYHKKCDELKAEVTRLQAELDQARKDRDAWLNVYQKKVRELDERLIEAQTIIASLQTELGKERNKVRETQVFSDEKSKWFLVRAKKAEDRVKELEAGIVEYFNDENFDTGILSRLLKKESA